MRRAAGDRPGIWLEPLTARDERRALVVEVPAESRAWVEASFARLIAACAKAVLGAERARQLVSRNEHSSPVRQARTFTGSAFNPASRSTSS